jgi:hypothetical protein
LRYRLKTPDIVFFSKDNGLLRGPEAKIRRSEGEAFCAPIEKNFLNLKNPWNY